MITATLQKTLDGGTFEEVAIRRIQEYEPAAGYRLAFSGGKDSIVIKHLADRAGVKYQAHYSMTTIDPPEIYQFIRKYHPNVVWHRPKRSMFKIIEQKV
jgi:phosphoadenosine phosphosulfate reductase